MKKNKDFKDLSVSQKMKEADELGAKVAKIMNEARAKANKLLLKSGHGVNINVDFYKLEEEKDKLTQE